MRADLFSWIEKNKLLSMVTLMLNNINFMIGLSIDSKKDKLIPEKHQNPLKNTRKSTIVSKEHINITKRKLGN